MINNGHILEMRQAFGDYVYVVCDEGYIIRIDVSWARCFVMNMEIRRVEKMIVGGKK